MVGSSSCRTDSGSPWKETQDQVFQVTCPPLLYLLALQSRVMIILAFVVGCIVSGQFRSILKCSWATSARHLVDQFLNKYTSACALCLRSLTAFRVPQKEGLFMQMIMLYRAILQGNSSGFRDSCQASNMSPECEVCRGPRYIEVDIDIGSSSAAAHVTGLVQGSLKSLVIDLAVVLEGRSQVRFLSNQQTKCPKTGHLCACRLALGRYWTSTKREGDVGSILKCAVILPT